MKSLLSSMFYLSFFFSAAYAGTNIDYCTTPQAWAAQITLAKLRNSGFDPQPLPKVELLSQQKLSGVHPLLSSKKFGDLYSQTLLITVASLRHGQASKHFIVSTIVSDQECSIADPIIIDHSLVGESTP